MEDLDMEDHLSGRQRAFLKLSFRNVNELMEVRRELLPAVKRNTSRANVAAAYEDIHDDTRPPADLMDAIIDMREYDVPYYTRVSIDRDVRVGAWYVLARRACVCVCVRARVCVLVCAVVHLQCAWLSCFACPQVQSHTDARACGVGAADRHGCEGLAARAGVRH